MADAGSRNRDRKLSIDQNQRSKINNKISRPTTSSLWRNVSFLLMWSSVAASGFGDRLIQLAAEPMLGVNVEEGDPQAARITAGVMFFFLLPYMVCTVAGGWLADRVPRKWIMLACDEGRAIVLLVAVFMAAGLGSTQVIPVSHHWKIYLILVATGCFAAIFNPAKQSTVPQIVPAWHLQQANAVLAGIALIASLIGLKIGAPIVQTHSVKLGILLGVISFGISGWFFVFLKIRPKSTASVASTARPGLFVQMAEALFYIRHHRPVRNLVILNILFWSAAWIVNAAIAAFSHKHYGLPYLTSKSNMMAALGAGLLCGSLFVLWMRTRRESGIVAMASLVVASVSMVLLAANRVYLVGLGLAFVIGLFGGVFMICVDTLTQSITPNYLRGRIFGMRAMLNTTFAVMINFAIWRSPAADYWMIHALYVTAGVMGLVAVWGLVGQMTNGPIYNRCLNVLWRLTRLYTLVWHRLQWTGREKVPSTGAFILAANHTAALDPMLIQAMMPRRIRWVMLKRFQNPWLSFLWNAIEPIALESEAQNIKQMREMLRVLEEGQVLGVFPEGGLQRDKRELRPFHAGIGLLTKRSKAPILPVWITGTSQAKHMFWHFFRFSRSRLIVGDPFRPDPNLNHEQIVQDLRARLIELGGSQ